MSKNKITLYGFAQSTYVRTARLVCEEKSIDYSIEPGGFGSAEFRALHPFGKMPAMRHGKVVLGESLAIASYLDQVFDGPSLIPDDATARAHVLQWSTSCIDYLYDAVVRQLLKAMQAGVTPDDEVLAKSREVLAGFDGAIGRGGHLVGASVTLADLYLWPMLAFAAAQPAGKALLADFPGLSSAIALAESRESYNRTAS